MKTKELTIEEKAKAYDEVLERAKELLEVGLKDTRDKRVVLSFFPELAESEDERIRNIIFDCLYKCCDSGVITREQRCICIAWLEKQGEQKSMDKVEPKFNIGDTVTVKPMSCHGKAFKGEPFKIVDIIEDNYVSDDGKTYSISLQDGWELVEQKPDWSGEDGSLCMQIEELLKVCWVKKLLSFDLYKKMCDFLKSLKDRVQPQPQQEWSEEDERSIKDSIFYLKSAKKYFEKDDDILWDEKWFNLCVEWLESLYKRLQPQQQWKPTEEQLVALRIAIGDEQGSDCCDKLRSLLEDLSNRFKAQKGEKV